MRVEKNITVRRAVIEDVDEILKIELSSFPTPWSREAFVGELTQNNFAQYFIIEYDYRIVGYVGMWLILDEAHITNIAILPEARGLKLGEFLMRYVMNAAKLAGASGMTLEVRVSNEVAIMMYKKLKFEEHGIRKNYYDDHGKKEDAIIMWVKL